MIFPDYIHFLKNILFALPPLFLHALCRRILAIHHKRNYKATSRPKNIIVIGGSFAGIEVAKRLAESLPTGYRVVLIEKNSHFNFLFAFPRFNVVKGYEKLGFIPYADMMAEAPEGVYMHVQDTVLEVGEKEILMEQRGRMEFEMLVIATGTSSTLPSKVSATNAERGCVEMQGMQERIEKAGKIAVVGGGAVGVQTAGDIKGYYPEKQVRLLHSRERLLHAFGSRLGGEAKNALEELGVIVALGRRPQISSETNTLSFENGDMEEFDLVISCIGQQPNSSLLSNLSPQSISKSTSHILVQPTLQLVDRSLPHIFSLGDVALTGGLKQARAAYIQSDIVVRNIGRIITQQSGDGEKQATRDVKLKVHRPGNALEQGIKVTVGLKRILLYLQENGGREILIRLDKGQLDYEAPRVWRQYGADPRAAGLE